MKNVLLVCGVLIAMALGANAQTTASGQFSLQGRLMTSSGQIVANGQQNLTVNGDARGSSTPIYTEPDVVTTVDGYFTTAVGDNGSGALNVDAAADYDLGI